MDNRVSVSGFVVFLFCGVYYVFHVVVCVCDVCACTSDVLLLQGTETEQATMDSALVSLSLADTLKDGNRKSNGRGE